MYNFTKKNHRKSIRHNRSGSWFIDNLGQLVLVAIGIGVGIYLIWAYVLHGPTDSIDKLSACGPLTGSKGECKASCDSDVEFELADIGCEGEENKCCVPKEDDGSIIMPSGYGGSDDYDFEVVGINVDLINGCTLDSGNSNAVKEFVCPANRKYSFQVDVELNNIGIKELPSVYAAPVVIINGNGDNIRKPSTYLTKVGVKIPAGATRAKVSTTVNIPNTDSKDGSYWDIYPYAYCSSKVCKNTDSKSRGILSSNTDKFITIKFADT